MIRKLFSFCGQIKVRYTCPREDGYKLGVILILPIKIRFNTNMVMLFREYRNIRFSCKQNDSNASKSYMAARPYLVRRYI
jgi:hypothetical protein